jgi:hypothetical protein
VKRALYKVALYEAFAQHCIAVAAFVVDRKHAIIYFEYSDVVIQWCHGNACTFKQISLCGYINPIAHD